MNRYSILVGICYAVATPIGVHIGIMMAYNEWLLVFIELVVLTLINLMAPFLWIRAQTIENVKFNQEINDESIINSISEIEDFTSGMDCENFKKDKKTILAVIMEIEVIVEALKKISKTHKLKNAELAFKEMVKTKEKIFHKYFGIDLDDLWNMIQKDLPNLKSSILAELHRLETDQKKMDKLKSPPLKTTI